MNFVWMPVNPEHKKPKHIFTGIQHLAQLALSIAYFDVESMPENHLQICLELVMRIRKTSAESNIHLFTCTKYLLTDFKLSEKWI